MNNTIRFSTRSAVSDTVPFCPSPFLISLLTLYTCINILYNRCIFLLEWSKLKKYKKYTIHYQRPTAIRFALRLWSCLMPLRTPGCLCTYFKINFIFQGHILTCKELRWSSGILLHRLLMMTDRYFWTKSCNLHEIKVIADKIMANLNVFHSNNENRAGIYNFIPPKMVPEP